MTELEDSTAPAATICGDASASAYLFAVWNLIVRPPRMCYTEEELAGDYPRKRFAVRGQPALRSDFELVGARGARLACTLFEPLLRGEGAEARRGAGERACVIFCHDSCSSRIAGFQLVPVFIPLNIGLACFDFAGSGRSCGENVSFGFHERDDLSCVIDYLRRVYGFSRIGLWGQTMGAAAALMHAPRDPTIAGVVADSPFIDVWTLLTEVCNNVVSLPPWLISPYLHMVRLIIKNKANFDICEVSPEAHARECFIPALFLHGEMNTFVAPRHSERLQRSYGGEARLLRMPGVAHSSQRPGEFLARAAAFLVRALRWEQHLPPGITEETLAALSAGRPLQAACAGDGSLEARRTCSLPPRGVLQLLAAPSARSRCLGLARAACELCSAYRGARYLTAALPGGGEAASPYRTARCPAELSGRVAFLAEGVELALCWVREGAAAESRAVVAFAVLSPTAVSLTRVTVLRCDAEPKCTLGCDSLSRLNCEPVETLGFMRLALELHRQHELCLRVSEDEASIAVNGLTLAAPLPGDGRLHLWCFHWAPAEEAGARPGGVPELGPPRAQLELGGEAQAPRAAAPAGEEAPGGLAQAVLNFSNEQLGTGKSKLPSYTLPGGNSEIRPHTLPSDKAGLPSYTLPCEKAGIPSHKHLAESLANICYGMQSPSTPWRAPAKIEVETQTTLQLSRSRSGSQMEEEPPRAPTWTAAAAAAVEAMLAVSPVTEEVPHSTATAGQAKADFLESDVCCEDEGLPWGPTTCPPGFDCKSRTLPQELQMPLDSSAHGQPAPGPPQTPCTGAPPAAKGAPPAAKGAPPAAKGTPPPAKGATLPAKGAAKGKCGPPKGPGKGKGKAGAAGGSRDGGKGREPRQPEVLPRVPVKRLFWTPISLDGAEEGTVWERVHRLGACFDRDELEALFAKGTPGPGGEAGSGGAGQASMAPAERERGQPRRLLEEQRRRQVWCMLARMPDRETALEAIVTMDDSILMPDNVDLLLANLPAPAEESMLRTAAVGAAASSSEEEGAAWDAPEAFLMRLVDIPMYALRVKAWAFLNAFQGAASRLATAEADCRKAGEYLQTSERIEHLLAVILHVGNYLNGGTPRGRADGFELDSLTKLGELKTCQRSTLLDFIVAQMDRDHTGMLEEIFAAGGEFDCVHRARRHKMSELREDLSSLLNQAEEFVLRMNRCVSDGDGFLERPCLQLQAQVAHLKVLAERFDGWNTSYTSLCTWFRIDTGKQMPTDEFFGIWDAFLMGVRAAREASGQRRQQGRRPSRASSAPVPRGREQNAQAGEERPDSSVGPRRQPARKRSERAQLPTPTTPRRPSEGPPATRADSAPPREESGSAAGGCSQPGGEAA